MLTVYNFEHGNRKDYCGNRPILAALAYPPSDNSMNWYGITRVNVFLVIMNAKMKFRCLLYSKTIREHRDFPRRRP